MKLPFTPLTQCEERGFDIGFFAGAATTVVMFVLFNAIGLNWLVLAFTFGLLTVYHLAIREGWL